MSSLRFESPLIWPDWLQPTPRASQRRDHGFDSSLTLPSSIEYLEQEVHGLNASAVLLLDIDQPLVERLRRKVGGRTGACLRLRHHEKVYIIACDRWSEPEHNIYALHLALRQWRNMERWGIAPLSVLLQGFGPGIAAQASSQAAWMLAPWMEELGLGPTATLEDAVAIYHRRAKLAAQDTEALTRLNILIEEAREYFAARTS